MAHSTESSRMNKTSLRWTKIDTPFYILFEAKKLLNRERRPEYPEYDFWRKYNEASRNRLSKIFNRTRSAEITINYCWIKSTVCMPGGGR